MTPARRPLRPTPLDREIAALAVPALGALVAEPLFLATDSALVGHLGATQLAGLGVAGTILQTAIGLLIFLAYATTPAVARRLGAGDERGAIRAGIDGMWLALGVGVVLAAVGWVTAPALAGAFGAGARTTAAAVVYLRIAVLGLPAMLIVTAAVGLFRGLQDTRTPLVIAVIGFATNAGLNALLIYPVGWGIAGSAAGTVVAQTGMATTCVVIAVRTARRTGAGLRPGVAGVSSSALTGGWLLVRTASLRVALVATVVVATREGTTTLAAQQVVFTLFSTLALALDAFAIAGQALTGHGLGAADVPRVRAVVRRLLGWGVLTGLVLGALLAATSPVIGGLFTSDPAVRAAIAPGALVLAASQPLGAVVFVLDGILIGAGDARYLAWTGVVNLAVFVPLLALASLAPPGAAAVVAIQLAFCVGYLAARCVTLSLRARGTRWIVTGAR
ncbi:MATE family efflux transporter [Pseudolysinimonas sp.]|uniref:MATE family efflux transporter n=1 Tax=Pseudolysinimonas sp. TaxID=2680009 RepID=UPI003F7F9B9F